jgi:hypothetical protein
MQRFRPTLGAISIGRTAAGSHAATQRPTRPGRWRRHPQRASQAPTSERLAYGDDVVWRRELRDLVAQGERLAAVAFLEQMARTNIAGRIDLREWAASLRRGGAASGPSFDAA